MEILFLLLLIPSVLISRINGALPKEMVILSRGMVYPKPTFEKVELLRNFCTEKRDEFFKPFQGNMSKGEIKEALISWGEKRAEEGYNNTNASVRQLVGKWDSWRESVERQTFTILREARMVYSEVVSNHSHCAKNISLCQANFEELSDEMQQVFSLLATGGMQLARTATTAKPSINTTKAGSKTTARPQTMPTVKPSAPPSSMAPPRPSSMAPPAPTMAPPHPSVMPSNATAAPNPTTKPYLPPSMAPPYPPSSVSPSLPTMPPRHYDNSSDIYSNFTANPTLTLKNFTVTPPPYLPHPNNSSMPTKNNATVMPYYPNNSSVVITNSTHAFPQTNSTSSNMTHHDGGNREWDDMDSSESLIEDLKKADQNSKPTGHGNSTLVFTNSTNVVHPMNSTKTNASNYHDDMGETSLLEDLRNADLNAKTTVKGQSTTTVGYSFGNLAVYEKWMNYWMKGMMMPENWNATVAEIRKWTAGNDSVIPRFPTGLMASDVVPNERNWTLAVLEALELGLEGARGVGLSTNASYKVQSAVMSLSGLLQNVSSYFEKNQVEGFVIPAMRSPTAANTNSSSSSSNSTVVLLSTNAPSVVSPSSSSSPVSSANNTKSVSSNISAISALDWSSIKTRLLPTEVDASASSTSASPTSAMNATTSSPAQTTTNKWQKEANLIYKAMDSMGITDQIMGFLDSLYSSAKSTSATSTSTKSNTTSSNSTLIRSKRSDATGSRIDLIFNNVAATANNTAVSTTTEASLTSNLVSIGSLIGSKMAELEQLGTGMISQLLGSIINSTTEITVAPTTSNITSSTQIPSSLPTSNTMQNDISPIAAAISELLNSNATSGVTANQNVTSNSTTSTTSFSFGNLISDIFSNMFATDDTATTSSGIPNNTTTQSRASSIAPAASTFSVLSSNGSSTLASLSSSTSSSILSTISLVLTSTVTVPTMASSNTTSASSSMPTSSPATEASNSSTTVPTTTSMHPVTTSMMPFNSSSTSMNTTSLTQDLKNILAGAGFSVPDIKNLTSVVDSIDKINAEIANKTMEMINDMTAYINSAFSIGESKQNMEQRVNTTVDKAIQMMNNLTEKIGALPISWDDVKNNLLSSNSSKNNDYYDYIEYEYEDWQPTQKPVGNGTSVVTTTELPPKISNISEIVGEEAKVVNSTMQFYERINATLTRMFSIIADQHLSITETKAALNNEYKNAPLAGRQLISYLMRIVDIPSPDIRGDARLSGSCSPQLDGSSEEDETSRLLNSDPI